MYQNDYKNLRNSGRVTRKTIYGEKFDYGEKVKEKRNYILYVSGTGREKKEIEEIQLPPPETKILEEHEIIDNYKYRESKMIKKHNPEFASYTSHKRLSSPIEKTTYTEVTEDGTPIQSNTTYSNNPVGCNLPMTKNVRTEAYINEKYSPIKNNERNIQNYSFQKNVRKFGEKPYFQSNRNEIKTETKQGDGYFVKVTTSKNVVNKNQRSVSGNYNVMNKTPQPLRKIGDSSGKNYGYYESKNVKNIGRINSPPTYQYRRGEQKITTGYGKRY